MNAIRYFTRTNIDGDAVLIARDAGLTDTESLLRDGWVEVYVTPRPEGAVFEEVQAARDAVTWEVTMPNGDVHQFDPTTLDILRAEAQALLFLIEEVQSHEAARTRTEQQQERNNLIRRWINWFNEQHVVTTTPATMVDAIHRLVDGGQVPPDA